MASILENFDRKLKTIDNLITPIYETMNETRRLLDNVDQSSLLVDDALHHYERVQTLNEIISAGANGNIAEYLSTMNQIEESIIYFQNFPSPNEFRQLKQLQQNGAQTLFIEIQKIIDRYTNPFVPKDLMELYKAKDFSKGNEINATQMIDMENLRKCIFWFVERGTHQNVLEFYAEKRAGFVRRSLERLVEHLTEKSNRRHSINPVLFATSNALTTSSSTEKLRKHEKKPSDGNRRSVRLSFHGSMSKGLGNTLLIPSNVGEEFEKDLGDKLLTEKHIELLDAFLFLIIRERDLLKNIFPPSYQQEVLSKLLESPLAQVRRETEKLCQAIERASRKLDTVIFSIDTIFTILQWFSNSKETFADFLQSKTNEKQTSSPISILSDPLEKLAINCFQATLDEVRIDTSPISDGGHVHPLTSHVLVFIEALLKYQSIVTHTVFLYSQQSGSQNIPPPITTLVKEQKVLFYLGFYIVQLINAWYENISRKTDKQAARQDTVLRTVFLLNNINFLLKRVVASPIMKIIELCEPNMKDHFEAKQNNNYNDFKNQFSPLYDTIMKLQDYENSHQIPHVKLNDRDRDKIKETFTNVNAAIELIQVQCQSYMITDLDLRERLRNLTKTTILELYTKFYEKFSLKDFTKHREKYVRYDPQKLEKAIETFF